MRKYIEAIEILNEESSNEEADFIRIDVTDLPENKVNEIIDIIKELFNGLNYELSFHYCYHEDGKSCIKEAIRQ